MSLEAQQYDHRIDAVKVVAVLLVVLVHVCSPHFAQFSEQWAETVVYATLARPGVPLFFMITGALLLPRTADAPRTVLKRRLPRVVLPLLFWSAAYLLWKLWIGEQVDLFGALFGRPVMYHLWYLYVAIGIGLFVPLLSAVWAENRRLLAYYTVVWFVAVGLVAPISELLQVAGAEDAYGLSTFLGFAGFLPLGALIYSSREHLASYLLPICGLFLLSAVAVAALTYWHSVAVAGAPSEYMLVYTNAPVILMSASLFAGLLCLPLPGSVERVAARLGAGALGVYGVHLLVLYFLWRLVNFSAGNFPLWLGIPLTTLVTAAVSVGIALTMRLVKPLRIVA